MDALSFQYPAYYVIFCMGLGLIYALVLYFRHSFIKDPTPAQQLLLKGLGVVRFIVVTLIAILLLSPFIKTKFTETQKPVILFLQDNSESIGNALRGQDSSDYITNVNNLSQQLTQQFELKEYSFSENVEPHLNFSYDGKLTNLSNNLSDLFNLFANQNVGAVVVASDGIYNKGANPLYSVSNIKFPIYTVAIGDTTPKKDLYIEKVYSNRIVYLNDRFKIKVDVASSNMESARTGIRIYDVGTKGSRRALASSEIEFSADSSFISREFILDAPKTGLQHYQVVLNPVDEEYTKANNYKDVFIDVLDSRQKILIAGSSPHPDIAALSQAIESNKNYEVSVKMIHETANLKPAEYNLVILHQLPAQSNRAGKFLESIEAEAVPALFIVGAQTHLTALDEVQNAIKFGPSGKSFNEATALLNEDFSLFTLSDELKRRLIQFPPLSVPFGQYTATPSSRKFLFQKIGTVATEYPLLIFHEAVDKKIAILCGEGIWKWRLFDFLTNQNHDLTNELITKTVQYLAVKEDKRQFRVILPKNVFYENESINFQAELYNDSYELINIPDANITLIDEEGKEYPYTFNKTATAYSLDAGNFPVGDYTFIAKVKFGGKELSYNGKFTITPMQLEAFNTVANHQLLYQLSEKSGGQIFYPSELEALGETLLNNNDLKPVVFSTYKTESLINFKWLFALFLGLLSLEWFIRKYEGGY